MDDDDDDDHTENIVVVATAAAVTTNTAITVVDVVDSLMMTTCEIFPVSDTMTAIVITIGTVDMMSVVEIVVRVLCHNDPMNGTIRRREIDARVAASTVTGATTIGTVVETVRLRLWKTGDLGQMNVTMIDMEARSAISIVLVMIEKRLTLDEKESTRTHTNVVTTNVVKEARTSCQRNTGNPIGMVIAILLESCRWLKSQPMLILKRIPRNVTVDIPHPVLGKVVNRSTENRQVIINPTISAIPMAPEAAPTAALVIDGVVITELVPVGNIVVESMMTVMTAMTTHRHHRANGRVGSVGERAAENPQKILVPGTIQMYQSRTTTDVVVAAKLTKCYFQRKKCETYDLLLCYNCGHELEA